MLKFAKNIINTLREPLITLDQNLRVVTVNRSFYSFFKTKSENTIGYLIFELKDKQWDISVLRELLKKILPQKTSFDDYEVQHDFAVIGRRIMRLNARQVEGKERIILLVMEDITERADELVIANHKKERLVRKLKRKASLFNHADESIMITDASATITEVNGSFSRNTGYTPDEAGESPRILQSGRHSSAFYAEMWATLLAKGYWRGEIWNRRKHGKIYPLMLSVNAVKDTTGIVQHYVSLSTDITSMKAYQGELERIAHYDSLTNLLNRVLLADDLNYDMLQCQRSNRTLAVMFLDLYGFKEVNDNHGHDLGDELLITVSQSMQKALREGDTLARIGGDEFIAVIADLQNNEDSTPILECLLKAA